MYILGVSMGHDASACLVNQQGEIVAAVSEERFSRIKSHTGFPYHSIASVLALAGIDQAAVSHVAVASRLMFFPGYAWNDYFFSRDWPYLASINVWDNVPQNRFVKLARLLIEHLWPADTQEDDELWQQQEELFTRQLVQKGLEATGFGHATLHMVGHHHAHACSAFYTSGVQDALVVTMDCEGDGSCASASIAEAGQLTCISMASSDYSPGTFYSQLTAFLGFKPNRHEGKITGLAAFGNKDRYYRLISPFLRFNTVTEQFESAITEADTLGRKWNTVVRIWTNNDYEDAYDNLLFDLLRNKLGKSADGRDLAAAFQTVLEDAISDYVLHFRQKFPSGNLLLAGGVFANVKLNQRLAGLDGTGYIHIHQNMGDGGLSVGAATSVLYETLGQPYRNYRPPHVYLGNAYDDAAIEQVLQSEQLAYRYSPQIECEIAGLIHAGKIVGRFNGAMEYGPRALGNRSILARPTDKGINDWLNKKLRRTEFMPFAPAILFEEATKLLENFSDQHTGYAACFMTITFEVKAQWRDRLQAVTHVDGTARPQLVHQQHNPSFHKILQEYCRLSGIPAVINTSFNLHEEPLVATPADAVRAFRQGRLDYLAIGNFLVAGEAAAASAG